jgi:uncharacterized membrane protein YbhN (UPF0104 family)
MSSPGKHVEDGEPGLESGAPGVPEQGAGGLRKRRTTGTRRHVRLVPLLKVVVTAVLAVYLLRVLANVDWPQVMSLLVQLTLWELAVLLVGVLVRQVLTAGPLALFVPAAGIVRAVWNDLTAVLISTAAPPPSDLVLRTAMFQSWGIPLVAATSGLAINSLTYYVARFGAPVIGVLLALAAGTSTTAYVVTAVVSGAIALAIVLGLVAVARGARAAGRLGRLAGGLAHRIVPSRADPDVWSQAMVAFQARAGDRLRRSGGWAGLYLVGLLFAEGLMLVLCLRFVGVTPAQLSVVAVLIALFVSYPLTALPFSGLGVLDAAVSSILIAEGSVDATSVTAALVIWRVCLLGVPLLLGGLGLILWRRSRATDGIPASPDG